MGRVFEKSISLLPKLFRACVVAVAAVGGVNRMVPAAGVIWRLLKLTEPMVMASA